LTTTIVTTKSILLKSGNGNNGGSDTNYLRDRYSNGVLVGDYSYLTTFSYAPQVLAFSNIRHYSNTANNYTWYAYIIDCD
jgi:hypothetical protein